MFQVHYETAGQDGHRTVTAENLSLNAQVQHAIAAFGQVLTLHAANIVNATLVEIHVRNNEYQVKHTLAKFERDGLT